MVSRDTPENCITNLNRYLKILYLSLIKNSKKLKFEFNNYFNTCGMGCMLDELLYNI